MTLFLNMAITKFLKNNQQIFINSKNKNKTSLWSMSKISYRRNGKD